MKLQHLQRLAGIVVMEKKSNTNAIRAYSGMFSGLQLAPDHRKEIESAIVWANEKLEREDRIVWYLRWFRAAFLDKFIKSFNKFNGSVPVPPGLEKAYTRSIADVSRRSGFKIDQFDATNDVSRPAFQQVLIHYLSMNLPQINAMVWNNQTPDQLTTGFGQIETEWKRNLSQTIDMEGDEQAELIMAFPDGFAWFNLHRSVCDAEAEAMGHCGNAASREGTILSLRHKVNKGNRTLWRPVATFILDDDGYLGEMKGRGNDKPVEDYHPYIVALLKHDMIKGINGGGYKPENNFSLADLSYDEREAVKKANPGLRSLSEQFHETGWTDQIEKRISDILRRTGVQTDTLEYREDQKEVVLKRYRDIGHLLRDYQDNAMRQVYDAIDEGYSIGERDAFIRDNISDSVLEEIIEHLPMSAQNRLAMELNIGSSYRGRSRRMEIVDRLRNAPADINDLFISAIEEEINFIDKKELGERLREYLSTLYTSPSGYFQPESTEEENWWNEPILGTVTVNNFLDIVDCLQDGDIESCADSGIDVYVLTNGDGWFHVTESDWESTRERRQEEGLIDEDDPEQDALLSGKTLTDIHPDRIAANIADRLNNPRSSRVPDHPELKFESSRRALLRRAGILR